MPLPQMRRPHKRLRTSMLLPAAMFVLKLMFLALLATPGAQSGKKRCAIFMFCKLEAESVLLFTAENPTPVPPPLSAPPPQRY